jgi:hypothetical protein
MSATLSSDTNANSLSHILQLHLMRVIELYRTRDAQPGLVILR